jgi:hypothetical protein
MKPGDGVPGVYGLRVQGRELGHAQDVKLTTSEINYINKKHEKEMRVTLNCAIL